MNESVSDSFNVTLSNKGTQISFGDIINAQGVHVPPNIAAHCELRQSSV